MANPSAAAAANPPGVSLIQPSSDVEATAIAAAVALTLKYGLNMPSGATPQQRAKVVGEMAREILNAARISRRRP